MNRILLPFVNHGTRPFVIILLLVLFSAYLSAQSDRLTDFSSEMNIETAEEVWRWHLPGDIEALKSQEIYYTGRTAIFSANGLAGKVTGLPENFLFSVNSENGRFRAMVSRGRATESVVPSQSLQIEVTRANGERLGRVSQAIHSDEGTPQILLNNDGSLILADAANAVIRRFDVQGRLQQTLRPIGEVEHNLERSFLVDIAGDAETMVLAATEQALTPTSSKRVNLFYFKAGQELWRRELPGSAALRCQISPDASHIVLALYDSNSGQISIVLDLNGRQIFQAPFLFKQTDFSKDGSTLVWADNGYLQAVDLAAGSLLHQRRISQKNVIITAVRAANRGRRTLVLQAGTELSDHGFIFNKPQVIVLDAAGEISMQKQFPQQRFYNVALAYDDLTKICMIGFQHSFQTFRVQ